MLPVLIYSMSFCKRSYELFRKSLTVDLFCRFSIRTLQVSSHFCWWFFVIQTYSRCLYVNVPSSFIQTYQSICNIWHLVRGSRERVNWRWHRGRSLVSLLTGCIPDRTYSAIEALINDHPERKGPSSTPFTANSPILILSLVSSFNVH